jgi:transglutaminase-like putative cysteine protease
LALSLLSPALGQETAQKATERWYEIVRAGHKVGYTRVVWAPSTWKGKKTIHDTTTVVRRTVRDMAGVRDVFETSVGIDLERDLDGSLWWMKTVSTEGSRVTTDELSWTGAGYVQVTQVGDDPPQRLEYALERPVMTDAEAFLSERVRRGELKPGQTFSCPLLDARTRGARAREVKVIGTERIDGETGPLDCLKVVERDPASGDSTTFWLDPAGAFVRLRASTTVYRRVLPAKAKELPVQPPSFSVTTPSFPPLERVFSAERLGLDLHLQGDPERELPAFPASPWSKVVSQSGSDQEGWVIKLQLTRYDDTRAAAKLPVDAKKFAKDLEPTPLMPTDHPRLRAKAKEIVAGETDARKAAHLIARYVHGSLAKQSPNVASTTALEILEQGMGDCSEHCVLFVTLCRAAGIPARRAHGYVNIGSMWGAHDWAEIWVGKWIGADPTTGEVGTQARYLFFGYPDVAGSFPGVVSRRASRRMRFVATELQERGGRVYDLTREDQLRVSDPVSGRYSHTLAGIELSGVPETWEVRLSGDGYVSISGPGLSASIRASADQGYDLSQFGGANGTYASAPATIRKVGDDTLYVWAHSRRRLVQLTVRGGNDEQRKALEKALAETFTPQLKPTK